LLATAVSLALSACSSTDQVSEGASSPQVSAANPTPSIDPAYLRPAPQPSPAAPGETVYPDFGVRTATPPADSAPRLSQAQAIAIAEASDFKSASLMPGAPTAVLRLYTDHDFPQSKAAAPFPISGARNVGRLAWVLTYANSPVLDLGGPAAAPGETPAPVPSDMPKFTYDFVMAIDANSGEIIGTFQPGRRVQ
jgi:hypothetical protein